MQGFIILIGVIALGALVIRTLYLESTVHWLEAELKVAQRERRKAVIKHLALTDKIWQRREDRIDGVDGRDC